MKKNKQKDSLMVFHNYFKKEDFFDRFKSNKNGAVDVIIPVIHTNELWQKNLLSIYREIPVNRLLIGDGGSIDNSIRIVSHFPRVEVFDQRKIISLGYSIIKLIEEVETEWFVYLHSDVYIPKGWFENMEKYKKNFDWFECGQHLTLLVDYPTEYKGSQKERRPLSGSQMGRRTAFDDILPKIQDDYLYRNEDAVLAALLKEKGFRYGFVNDVFHYHQIMEKKSQVVRKIKNISFNVEKSKQEIIRENEMEIRAIVKYTKPNKFLIRQFKSDLIVLYLRTDFDLKQFIRWVKQTNSIWLSYIKPSTLYFYKLIYKILSSKIFGKEAWHKKIHRVIKFFDKSFSILFD